MPPPFIMGGGGGAYSITLVRTYVHPVPYVRKMFSGWYLLKTLVYWIHIFIFHTQVYNHKIQVKFDYGQNTPIIVRVMALDLRMKMVSGRYFLKT